MNGFVITRSKAIQNLLQLNYYYNYNNDYYKKWMSTMSTRALPGLAQVYIRLCVSGEWTLSALMKILGEEREAREMTATPEMKEVQ